MGVAKKQAQERRSRRQARNNGIKGHPANWMLADPAMLQYAVTSIAQKGGAVRLGYTRDGGAYAIGIYGDGEPYTEYIRPDEDINEYLRQLSEDFGNITGDGSYVGS